MARALAGKIKLVVGSNLLSNGLSLACKIALVRITSLAVYGLYRQVLLAVEILSAFFRDGLPKSLYYFFPALSPRKKRRLLTQTLGLLGGSGIIIWAGLYFFAPFFARGCLRQPGLAPYLRIAAWWAPSLLAYSAFTPLLISSGREELAALVSFGGSLARNAGVVLVFFISGRLDGALWFLVWLGAAQVLLMTAYMLHQGLLGALRPRLDLLREQLAHALPLSLSKLTGSWARHMDKLVVSFFLSSGQFALYSVGAAGLPFINAITHSANNVLLPRYSSLLREGRIEEFRRLWHNTMIQTARLIFPLFVFFFVFAEPFFRWLYSARYLGGAQIFRIYLCHLPLYFTGYGVVLRAINRTGLILKYTLLLMTLNLFLSVFLFKLMGITGPAASTVLCAYFIVTVYLRQIRRVTGLETRHLLPYKGLGRIFGLACLCGGLLAPLPRLPLNDAFLVCSGALLYGIFYLAGGHLSGISPWREVRTLILGEGRW